MIGSRLKVSSAGTHSRRANGTVAAAGLLACIAAAVIAASATAVRSAAVVSQALAALRTAATRSRTVDAAIVVDACAYDTTLARARAPKWAARVTGGPALEGLRSLGARLRSDGLTLQLQDPSIRIESVSIGQVGTRATATATEIAHVRYYRRGRALGPPRALHQQVQMRLERASTMHFFRVWKVAPTTVRIAATSQRV